MYSKLGFQIISIILVLWNLVGVLSFVGHATIRGERLAALPEEEQALYENFPIIITVIFAIAVITGMSGAIALIRKNPAAVKLLGISLVAVIIQMMYNVFFTGSIDYYGKMAIIVPALTVAMSIFALVYSKNYFASFSR